MDATLQLIMDQFRELKSEICTITSELKIRLATVWAVLQKAEDRDE